MFVAGICLLASTASAQTPPTTEDLLRLIDTQQKLIDEQGRRLDVLQKQVDDLRTPTGAAAVTDQPPQSSTTPDARGQRPEAPADIVRAGEFPGSFRIPGSDAAFKVGGLVRVNWVTTLDPLLVTDRFITADIPVDAVNPPVGGRVDVMAIPSRFNLDLRTPTGVGYMRAYLEADFAGSGNTLRLRHAFGQWRNLLFGQTWSTFADPEAEPDGIDFEGLNAISRFRQPQARWTWHTNGHLRAAVALQTAVLFRQLQGFPSNAPSNVLGINGWGVTASGRWPSPLWHDDDRIFFQVTGGDGIGRYITDLASAGGEDGFYDAATNTVHVLPVLARIRRLRTLVDGSVALVGHCGPGTCQQSPHPAGRCLSPHPEVFDELHLVADPPSRSRHGVSDGHPHQQERAPRTRQSGPDRQHVPVLTRLDAHHRRQSGKET